METSFHSSFFIMPTLGVPELCPCVEPSRLPKRFKDVLQKLRLYSQTCILNQKKSPRMSQRAADDKGR
jgi:hypothetical protein